MYFVLDVISIVIIIGFAIRYARSSISTILFRMGCVLISAVIALAATSVAVAPVSVLVARPMVEKKAAYEVADMVSGEHKGSAKATMDALDLRQLTKDCPNSFQNWTKSYGCSAKKACEEYNKKHDEYALLTTVTEKCSTALARSICYGILWIIMWIILLIVSVKIEMNLPSVKYDRKSVKRVMLPILGAICGVFVLMGIGVVLNWVAPAFEGRTVLLSTSMISDGVFFPIINWLNPLKYLSHFLLGV